jgi:hypothetical protein
MIAEQICGDLKEVLEEAKKMDCKTVNFRDIPIQNIETIISALEMKQKYETQWLDDMNNPLEPLKLSSALQSEIFKLEYRKANKPKEINILDYTVIYALKDCLDRYSSKNSRKS